MAAQEVAKNLDELIQELLKRARLALQQPDSHTPLQRSCARALLNTHQQERQRRATYENAKEVRTLARKEARKAQADRNHYAPPDDVRSNIARFLGLPTQRDRNARAAATAYRDARAIAKATKVTREDARETWRAATREAEKARDDFGTAFDLPVPRFEQRVEPQQESTPLPPQPGIAPVGPKPPKRPGMRHR